MPIPHSPNRIPACFLALCFVFLALIPAAAEPYIDFDLSPNKAGQLEPKLSAGWDWNDSFGGSLGFSSDNSTVYEEKFDDGEEEYPASYTTISQNFSGQIIPLIWKKPVSSFVVSVGGGCFADSLTTRETGYIDRSTTDRLFVNNVISLLGIKPALSLELETGKESPVQARVEGLYAPWMYIAFEQDVSSACATDPSFNTPRTALSDDASGRNAFQIRFSGSMSAIGMKISIDAFYEEARYAYKMLNFGGSTSEQDDLLADSGISASIYSPAVTIAGLMPKVGFGWYSSRAKTKSDDTAVTDYRFAFGFVSAGGRSK